MIVEKIKSVGEKAFQEIELAKSSAELEQIRIQFLGKKGAFSDVLKSLGSVDASERPKIGAAANEWKQKIETALDVKKEKFADEELAQKIAQDRADITLPSRRPHRGALHPITQTIRRIVEVFGRIGFEVTTGPEIETEFYNFEAVNIPKDHPARDMQDTFFLGPEVVLRTQTSSVQMREMSSRKWPIRVISPGAVYRSDSDATHSPMFHQIEGLWVDRNVKMSDLKGVLEFFAKEVFGSDTKIRLRPSYFPFVEPGAEVDVTCFNCKGKGCKLCKQTGWLEILGAGMVHPKLFECAGYDPREVTGFAFGMGIERIAMLLHEIPDLRLMFQSDIRFLKQF